MTLWWISRSTWRPALHTLRKRFVIESQHVSFQIKSHLPGHQRRSLNVCNSRTEYLYSFLIITCCASVSSKPVYFFCMLPGGYRHPAEASVLDSHPHWRMLRASLPCPPATAGVGWPWSEPVDRLHPQLWGVWLGSHTPWCPPAPPCYAASQTPAPGKSWTVDLSSGFQVRFIFFSFLNLHLLAAEVWPLTLLGHVCISVISSSQLHRGGQRGVPHPRWPCCHCCCATGAG